ncbi:hypothetical protein OH77DRAFT_666669 [Trametes cingulata]|nr:hypothetical protein OH77DRAFT_666669 [Trametes cingulata]
MSSPPRPTIRSATHRMRVPRPRGYYLETPKRKRATQLYAVDIPDDVICEYAEVFWNIYFPNEPRPIKQDEIDDLTRAIITFATESLYDAYPRLPRHNQKIRLITRGEQYWWLFVFKDDSSEALFNAPLDPSDVTAALEYLLIPDREPKWYDLRTLQRHDPDSAWCAYSGPSRLQNAHSPFKGRGTCNICAQGLSPPDSASSPEYE